MSSSVHSRWGRGGWNHLHRCAQTTSQHPQQVTGENALDLNGFHEHNTLQMYSKYVKYKRINKRRPEEEVSDRFSLLQSKSVSRSQCVKAGTEEKLVLHLLHSFAMGDSSFIAVFLATFRSFTSTQRVLEILIDRWGTRGSSSPHSAGWGEGGCVVL